MEPLLKPREDELWGEGSDMLEGTDSEDESPTIHPLIERYFPVPKDAARDQDDQEKPSIDTQTTKERTKDKYEIEGEEKEDGEGGKKDNSEEILTFLMDRMSIAAEEEQFICGPAPESEDRVVELGIEISETIKKNRRLILKIADEL